MRLAAVEIVNFRGIRRGVLEEIGEQPLLTISGRNGVGKSLALLAILIAWRGDLGSTEASQLVGPWGTSGFVRLRFSFSEAEWVEVRAFANRMAMAMSSEQRAVELRVDFDDLSNFSIDAVPDGAGAERLIIRHKEFRRAHSFAQLDLIPSERQISRYENEGPVATTLTPHETENWRSSLFIRLWAVMDPSR